jgi:hypothetical protein
MVVCACQEEWLPTLLISAIRTALVRKQIKRMSLDVATHVFQAGTRLGVEACGCDNPYRPCPVTLLSSPRPRQWHPRSHQRSSR